MLFADKERQDTKTNATNKTHRHTHPAAATVGLEVTQQDKGSGIHEHICKYVHIFSITFIWHMKLAKTVIMAIIMTSIKINFNVATLNEYLNICP